MAAETTTAIEVVDHSTGEVVDVTSAETERLAAFVETVDDLRRDLSEAEGVVLDELLHRLDRRGQWTLRVGDPASGVQYEVKAPSPTAGTTTYDRDVLRDGLRRLVADDVLDEEAAGAAMKRTISITAQVPVDAELETLANKVAGLEAIAGVPVREVKVDTAETPTAAGIKRLEAIGGEPAALAADCKGSAPAGSRRVKVTPKRRENTTRA